jgi:hypothetical protein
MSDQVENKSTEPINTDSKSIIITKSIKSLTSPEKTASNENINQENTETEKTTKALTEAEVCNNLFNKIKYIQFYLN